MVVIISMITTSWRDRVAGLLICPLPKNPAGPGKSLGGWVSLRRYSVAGFSSRFWWPDLYGMSFAPPSSILEMILKNRSWFEQFLSDDCAQTAQKQLKSSDEKKNKQFKFNQNCSNFRRNLKPVEIWAFFLKLYPKTVYLLCNQLHICHKTKKVAKINLKCFRVQKKINCQNW